MAIAHPPTARELGASFAEMIASEEAPRGLWFRDHRGTLELWLVTASADPDTERRLCGAVVSLQQRYPTVDLELRILNPRYLGDDDLTGLIPPGAEAIELDAV